MLKALILAALLQAPAPQLWQLADSHNVVCYSYDPAYLRRLVAWRNAEWARLAQAQPVVQAPAATYYPTFPAYSSCPGGSCYRR